MAVVPSRHLLGHAAVVRGSSAGALRLVRSAAA